jgi:hypothetical protein
MKMLPSLFSDSTNSKSLGNKFRQQRMLYFHSLIAGLPRPINILDVGGNEDFWRNAGMLNDDDFQITILNLTEYKVSASNVTSVTGDATDLSQYKDGQFDITFSNSVIEHLGSAENQFKMAHEVQRVGKRYFIQVPNKFFFLEPHYLLPFFNFLPKKLQYFILTKTKLSRGRKWDHEFARQYVDEIVLLSKSEFAALFPKAGIWSEKFFFMTKSFVAHNFNQ